MNTSEQRIIGALLLLLGISFLALATQTNQLNFIIELLKKAFP